MFTNRNSSHKDATLLDTSILSILGGVIISILYPPYVCLGTSVSWLGVCSIFYYFATWSKFDRLWKNLGLCKGTSYPTFKGKTKTDIGIEYKFTLPAGLCIDDFHKHELAIKQYLGKDIEIKYTYKEIVIVVLDITTKDYYDYNVTNCKGNLEFPIGYDRHGEIVTCDLSYGEPHLLIAGETGGGKSTALRSIITNIILTTNIKLHLIDLKRGAEFQIFGKCKNVVDFAKTKAEASDVLNKINHEVDRRYDLFYENDCVDINEYNKKVGKMERELLIVDEFAEIRNNKDDVCNIEDLSAKARACGIHIILSTQRPDSKVLNGRIKQNIGTILGLKSRNEINSRIIIDESGLENLRGNGQGLYIKGGVKELVQCPFLSPEQARELLKPTYVVKKPAIEENVIGDLLC